jgi:hypothetical protein
MIAVGTDVGLLVAGASALIARIGGSR